MIAKRYTLSLIIISLIAILMVLPTFNAEPVLRIWWCTPTFPEEKRAILEIASDFEEETGIHVKISFIPPPELAQKILAAVEAKSAPDLYWNHYVHIGPILASRGALLEVSDIIEELRKAGAYEKVLESALWIGSDGKRRYYGIPTGWYSMFLHVRTDLFKEAGYDWRKLANMTWEEFLSAVKKVHEIIKPRGMYGWGIPISEAAPGDAFDIVDVLIHMYGGDIFTPEGKLNIESPETKAAILKALNFLLNIQKGGLNPPGATGWTDWDNNVAFQEGVSAVVPNPTMSIPNWLRLNKPQWLGPNVTATILWPRGPTGKARVYLGARFFLIPTPEVGNRNVEGAKKFVKFFFRFENYRKYAVSIPMYLPVFKGIAEDPTTIFGNPKYANHWGVALKYIEYMDLYPYEYLRHPAYAQAVVEKVWQIMVLRVLTQGWKAEDAVNAAIERIKAIYEAYH